MSILKSKINKISLTDVNVLLTGESGTGKSFLARKIYSLSKRNSKAFTEVHCTNLSSTLFESELFGHVKGAFTGAFRDKVGKAQEAVGGTLFLDEVGELDLKCQSKILRLLQDKVITPVGSNKDIKIDARIILATNKNLLKMVKDGTFREDLYYRINMFEIKLEPLRKRKEEIQMHVERFIIENEQKLGLIFDKDISTELLEMFQQYDWPGNLRELKNVVTRLCCLSGGSRLHVEDLPDSFITKTLENNHEDFLNCDLSLRELEKIYIASKLNKHDSLNKVSSLLGITPSTLWRKRKEYNLV